MTKRKKIKDPHAKREAGKYKNPIPSREAILELLTNSKGPMHYDAISDRLGLRKDTDLEALRRRLNAMLRDGQLVKNRRRQYVPITESQLVTGRVIAHRDGYGFLSPDRKGDEKTEDLFLSPKHMRSLLHGDRAVARVTKVDSRGRLEGSLVEVLERAHQHIIGRFTIDSGIAHVIPDNKRIHQDILIPEGKHFTAQPGQIVVATIIEQPSRNNQPIGEITEVLGDHMAPGMEIDIALRSHDLPHEWPDDTLAEANTLGEAVEEADKVGRLDIRDLPLVTIDGADARDFDDAVYCEPLEGNQWRLLVAIADVSHYVKPDSALDKEAYNRATSVYFPKQVIPMLPESLSNGLCSINPDVDRLCMLCDMTIGKDGKIAEYSFHEAVMRSHARLTYDEVATIIVEKDDNKRNAYGDLVPHLDNLYSLYKTLRKTRNKRGAMNFETTETYFEFTSDKKISAIKPLVRNDAHKVIEECMILANVAAAKFLKKKQMPALYRIHEKPKDQKLEDLREFLSELGLKLHGGESPSPKDYAKVTHDIAGREDASLIQTVLLRSLNQAVYSPDHTIGHFGLAHVDYAHFTSPIRRYPDLLVHRAIRYILQNKKNAGYYYTMPDMQIKGEHCSTCERRADEASRDVNDWLKCEYMTDKLGETFTGIVSGVTSFGAFVQLSDIHVEGLVHITSLPKDYYHFDAVSHTLIGKNSGKKYRLGDKLTVTIASVSLEDRKIDFDLVDNSE